MKKIVFILAQLLPTLAMNAQETIALIESQQYYLDLYGSNIFVNFP